MILNGKQIKDGSLRLVKIDTSVGQGLTFSDAALATTATYSSFTTYSYVNRYWVQNYLTNNSALSGNGLTMSGRTMSILIDPASSGYISTSPSGLKIDKLAISEVYISNNGNITDALIYGFVGQDTIQIGDVLVLIGTTGMSGSRSYIYTSTISSTISTYYVPLDSGINAVDVSYIRQQISATTSILYNYNTGVISLRTDTSLNNGGTLSVNSNYVAVTSSNISSNTLNSAINELGNRKEICIYPDMSGFSAISSITQVGITYSNSFCEPNVYLNGVKQPIGSSTTDSWFVGNSDSDANVDKKFTSYYDKLYVNPTSLGYSVLETDGDVITVVYLQL